MSTANISKENRLRENWDIAYMNHPALAQVAQLRG